MTLLSCPFWSLFACVSCLFARKRRLLLPSLAPTESSGVFHNPTRLATKGLEFFNPVASGLVCATSPREDSSYLASQPEDSSCSVSQPEDLDYSPSQLEHSARSPSPQTGSSRATSSQEAIDLIDFAIKVFRPLFPQPSAAGQVPGSFLQPEAIGLRVPRRKGLDPFDLSIAGLVHSFSSRFSTSSSR